MPSDLFRLNLNDFWKGMIVAVFAAVLTYVASAVNAPGFSFASLDVNLILKVAVGALVGYLSKNLLTAENGKILGRIG